MRPSMHRRHELRRKRMMTWVEHAFWLFLTTTAWSGVALRETALRHPELFDEEGKPAPTPGATPPTKGLFKQAKQAVTDGLAHDIPRRGASLAYYSVFSMAPLVLIMIAVVGFFLGEDAAKGAVVGQMQGFLGSDKAAVVQDMVAAANKPGASAASGIVGIVVLLLGASAVVGELQTSLRAVFGVRDDASGVRSTVMNRLVSIGFVLGMGFLMLVSLFVSTGAAAAGKYLGDAIGGGAIVLQIVNYGVSVSIITAMFAAMFKVLPKAGIRWKDVWSGAFATAVLFMLGNLALGVYLGKAGPASAYGAAGSLMTILLWVYYCSQLLYFGAEFTRVRMGRPAQAVPLTRHGERLGRPPRQLVR